MLENETSHVNVRESATLTSSAALEAVRGESRSQPNQMKSQFFGLHCLNPNQLLPTTLIPVLLPVCCKQVRKGAATGRYFAAWLVP